MASNLETQINDAIGAHGMWKMRLKAAIRTGQSDITAYDASCDDACKFGKWLYGNDLNTADKAGMPYQVTKRLHAEFHRCAGTVLGHALAHRKNDAECLLDGEFTERSEKLVRALTKWKREAA